MLSEVNCRAAHMSGLGWYPRWKLIVAPTSPPETRRYGCKLESENPSGTSAMRFGRNQVVTDRLRNDYGRSGSSTGSLVPNTTDNAGIPRQYVPCVTSRRLESL